ncbi:MAG: hypothetical protein P1S46_02395 [bacterium]|nr:hypothetical protein [bacterium]MDT8395428.1 hypothetical protein [bacterium]
MTAPLFYILAPFGLAFGLFAVYLVVSIYLKDPARPFRMFMSPPIDPGEASAECSVQSAEESLEEEKRALRQGSGQGKGEEE